MKSGHIYLQYGFWKAIKEVDASVFGPNAWDIFCVFRSSKLHAEVPIELFGQDDLLSILWQESAGSCFIEAGQVDEILAKEDLKIENLCSVFLVDKDDNSCEEYSQEKGVLCLNAKMLSKSSYLIGEKSLAFDFLEKGSYYDLKEYISLPCNSAILIDPHILNERKYIDHHIKHLLNNILPNSLDIPFHLSIFSGIGKINDASLGESYYDAILEKLKDIRPKLDFSLTLYQIPIQGEGWHARYVITNNLMIHATEGFDFFGPVNGEMKAKKAGKFLVYCPWLEKNGDSKELSIWINKTAKESSNGHGYHHDRWGTKENRLFDLV